MPSRQKVRHSKRDSMSPHGEDHGTHPAESGTLFIFLIQVVLLPALLLLALAFVTIRTVPEPDVWFHMALGREVVENGHLPKTDLFSFTAAGREWISSGWASSVLLYLAYTAGQAKGIVWLTYAFAAAAHLLIYYTALVRYKTSGSVILVQFASIAAAALRYTPRPEIASHLFVTILCVILVVSTIPRHSRTDRKRDSPPWASRLLWFLPLLFLLWPNFHAGFLVGILAVAIFAAYLLQQAVRTRSRKLFLLLIPCALCAVTWMVNPYGWQVVALAGKIESIPMVKEKIYEWKPLLASGPVKYPAVAVAGFLFIVVAVVAAIPVTRMLDPETKLPWWNPALIALFTVLALTQRRHAGIAAVALPALCIPWIAVLDHVLLNGAAWKKFVLPTAAIAATAALGFTQNHGIFGTGRGLFHTAVQASLMPVSATEWLTTNPPPSNIYNTYGAGGYLLYHLHPKVKVFIDGRLDIYDHKTWLDYNAIENGSMPIPEMVKQYGVNTCILYTRDAISNGDHLVYRLGEDPQWKVVFFDDSYAVYVRQTPQTAAYIDVHGFRFANPFNFGTYEKALADSLRSNDVQAELHRMEALPGGGGAWAPALAAVAASRRGDQANAAYLAQSARQRDPSNPIVRQLLAVR